MTAASLMTDFALASLLIAIGQFLRVKIKIFQHFFVPAGLIGGFLGLFGGKQFLDIIPFSTDIGSYSAVLIVIVFAAIGAGGFDIKKDTLKQQVGQVYGIFSFSFLSVLLQIGFGVLFSILVISQIFPEINYGFGLILVAGFAGGHGTAAAIGKTFSDLGWADATDLGMTSATVGILCGILVGLAIIKWGARNGHTHYIKDFKDISNDMRTGLIQPENRKSVGEETTSSMSLDVIGWHLSWVLIASGAGYWASVWIKNTFRFSIPDFMCSFLAGIFMYMIFSRGKNRGVYRYIDDRLLSKISGTATDYLVFFGVASIKVSIIVKYATPLLMLMIFGILFNLLFWRLLAPTLFKDQWLERSMLTLGMAFGVAATGIILLRVIDPEGKSKTLKDFALANPFITPLQSFMYAVGPGMLLAGTHWQYVAMALGISAAILIVAKIFGWWYWKIPLDARKPGRNQP